MAAQFKVCDTPCAVKTFDTGNATIADMSIRDEYRRTTFRLPPGLYEQLRKVAAAGDRSANAQVIKYIREGLERDEAGQEAASKALGEETVQHAQSLSGEPVPAEDLELSFLRDALQIVEEGAQHQKRKLSTEEKAEWIVLVYRIKRMMPNFESADLAARIQQEMKAKGGQGKGGQGGAEDCG